MKENKASEVDSICDKVLTKGSSSHNVDYVISRELYPNQNSQNISYERERVLLHPDFGIIQPLLQRMMKKGL